MNPRIRELAAAPVQDALARLGYPGHPVRLLRAPREAQDDLYTNGPLVLAGGEGAPDLARRLADAMAGDERVESCRSAGPGFVYFRLADPVIAHIYRRLAAWRASPWREIPLHSDDPLAAWRSFLLRLEAIQVLETHAPGPSAAESPAIRRLLWALAGDDPAPVLSDFEDCFRRGEAARNVVRAVEGWLGPRYVRRRKENP